MHCDKIIDLSKAGNYKIPEECYCQNEAVAMVIMYCGVANPVYNVNEGIAFYEYSMAFCQACVDKVKFRGHPCIQIIYLDLM